MTKKLILLMAIAFLATLAGGAFAKWEKEKKSEPQRGKISDKISDRIKGKVPTPVGKDVTPAHPQPVCGNNVKEGDEACDGNDFAGQSCASQLGEYYGGDLSCASNCRGLVTDGCSLLCAPIPEGVMGLWKGEDVEDNNSLVEDSVGTCDGNTFFAGTGSTLDSAAGKVSNAFSFNGASARIEMPLLCLNLTGELTLEFWVHRDNSNCNPAVATCEEVLLQKRSGVGGYELRINVATGRVVFYINSSSMNSQNFSLSPETWHHVAAVYKPSPDGFMRIYVDGNLAANKTSGVPAQVNITDLRLNVGWDNFYSAASVLAYDGLLDEIAIYDRALSAEEIGAIFNADSHGKCPVGVP